MAARPQKTFAASPSTRRRFVSPGRLPPFAQISEKILKVTAAISGRRRRLLAAADIGRFCRAPDRLAAVDAGGAAASSCMRASSPLGIHGRFDCSVVPAPAGSLFGDASCVRRLSFSSRKFAAAKNA
jgi:hypothetical protein